MCGTGVHNPTLTSLRQTERTFKITHGMHTAGSASFIAAAPKKKGAGGDESLPPESEAGIAQALSALDEDAHAFDNNVKSRLKRRQKHHKKDRAVSRWLIDPRKSRWLVWWDLVTTLALLFTATVTPYEVTGHGYEM